MLGISAPTLAATPDSPPQASPTLNSGEGIATTEPVRISLSLGDIYVTTGLLRAADNEAQLASVLAHEIAHINQRHSIRAMQQAVLAQGIAETTGIDMNTLAQIGYQLTINLPRSREFEYAADAGGLQILQSAGYPPQAFVNFLTQLMDGSVQPEFLRTHPTSANRIQEIRSQLSASSSSSQQGTSESNYEAVIFPLN